MKTLMLFLMGNIEANVVMLTEIQMGSWTTSILNPELGENMVNKNCELPNVVWFKMIYCQSQLSTFLQYTRMITYNKNYTVCTQYKIGTVYYTQCTWTQNIIHKTGITTKKY